MSAKRQQKAKPLVTSHDTPFHPPVVAFAKGSLLRETYAQWWQPHYHSDLSYFLDAIVPRGGRCPEGLDNLWSSRRKPVAGTKVKVRIVLDYPLLGWQARIYTISTKRIGDIFGVAHDLYQEIYAKDDAEWRKTSYKKAPTVGAVAKKMLKNDVTAEQRERLEVAARIVNRARGVLVWGHEMSDLVFESMHFEFDAEAAAFFEKYKKARQVDIEKRRNGSKLFSPSSGRRRFDTKKHVIGTVTFGIGS